jgi:hypothetical protein
MEQLTLFPLDWREVVPLDPQPRQAGCWEPFPICRGDWVWDAAPGQTYVSTHPENNPRSSFWGGCPLKVGQYFRGGVIEKIDLMRTTFQGWVWVFVLREFKEDEDLSIYRDLLLRGSPPLTLWPPGEDDDVWEDLV